MKPFLDKLQSHKGGLIRLKTELWWYNVGDWDNNPGRVCLVLDAEAAAARARADTDSAFAPAAAAGVEAAAALLLVDGSTQWVWVAECDVEVI